MTRRKSILAFALVSLVALAMTGSAFGNSEFLFFGYSRYLDNPDQVGSVMEVYGILNPATEVPVPISLDLANVQYTVFVASMLVASFSETPEMKSLTFNGGVVNIYADAMGMPSFTDADYGDLSTFTDGELILVANVDDGWPALLWDFDNDGRFTAGSNGGTCDFVAGTRLGDLVAGEYYLDDWGFFGSPYVDPDPPWTTVPDGFHRIFNVKITAPNDPTPTELSTWGQVKTLYR
jgi:hypothetical protein